MSSNFLEDNLADIMKRKSQVKICERCISERLPEYNLGYNRAERQRVIGETRKTMQSEHNT